MQYKKEIGKKGYLTYSINGKYLYSSYDPFIEAKKYLDSIKNLKKNIITCCGADFINNELLKKDIDEIISFEPIKFDHFDDSSKIKRFDNIFEFKKYINQKNNLNFSLLIWQPLIESDPDFFLPLLNQIKEVIKKSIFSLKAEKTFSFIESKNFIRNISQISNLNFISKTSKKLSNPALIISSGYSLKDNLDFLKRVKDYSYFFALPSSLPFLFYNNIIPDYVIAVDPGYATYYHLIKYKPQINLISPLTINPVIFKLKNIRPILFNYNTFLETIFYNGINIISSPSEGTVFMNLLRILPELGFDDIIIVGQDFGYKENRSHINEGCFEKEFLSISNYFNSLESKIKNIETIKDITYIKDNKKNIKTDTSFSIYYNHFMQQNFTFNIFLTINSFNYLMNKYKIINSDYIINNYHKKEFENIISITSPEDLNTMKNNIFSFIKNIINCKPDRYYDFINKIGFIENDQKQKYFLNKYMENIF